MYLDHVINQRYAEYIQPFNQNVYSIVDESLRDRHPDWIEKNILDYGCNIGNLLFTSKGKLNPLNYTGVDVQQHALDIGSRYFPEATWIKTNNYHPAFNPLGDSSDILPLQRRPEIIICHGVFTHCDMLSIRQKLDYFKDIILPGGTILFSLWEEEHLSKYVDIFLVEKFNIYIPKEVIHQYKNSIYLVDREYSIADSYALDLQQCSWLETFFKRDYILEIIPEAIPLGSIGKKHSIFVIHT